jgi:hypothetical protein
MLDSLAIVAEGAEWAKRVIKEAYYWEIKSLQAIKKIIEEAWWKARDDKIIPVIIKIIKEIFIAIKTTRL